MAKHELGSDPWLEVMRAELADGLAGVDLEGIEFCLSEEYTDPPDHLRRGDAPTIGWHLRIIGGHVEVHPIPDDNADMRVVADYVALLPLAYEILPDDGPSDAVQERVAALVADGKLQMHGDRTRMPAVLQRVNLHNRLAPHTA